MKNKIYHSIVITICLIIPLTLPQVLLGEQSEPIKGEVAELIYTDKELAELSKWKNKTMDALIKDALCGDRAGLYNIGMSFLIGMHGFVIDVEMANGYFAQSASLGFAPGLDKLANMYIKDKGNPFLAMVYLNLAASSGHSELVIPYHKIRAMTASRFGNNVVVEVEKIATDKKKKIDQNLEYLKNKDNTDDFNLLELNITQLDFIYSMDYWQKFTHRVSDD